MLRWSEHDDGGSTTVYDIDRDALNEWARAEAAKLVFTPGQAATLARVLDA